MNSSVLIRRLRAWLHDLPISDPVDREMGVLLQVILLGFLGILIMAGGLNLLLAPEALPPADILIQTGVALLATTGPLLLLRRGAIQLSVWMIIALLLVAEGIAILTGNLRGVAETLTFFTFAIVLAGLFLGRLPLAITFGLSLALIGAAVSRPSDPTVQADGLVIAINYFLLNGLMALFLDRFGLTLRRSLKAALERETQLQAENQIRQQAETTLERFTERLAILHEIDRALLAAASTQDISRGALARIRKLVPCPRASVTLFDLEARQASFLAADFEGVDTVNDAPMPLEEYGLHVVEGLLQNRPWFTDDIWQDPRATELDRTLAQEQGIHAWLSLPLFCGDELIGALNLGRGRGERFTQEEAEIAHDVANQLAITLQQGRLYAALQKQLAEHAKLIAELETTNAELERFTYTVSHDLRNPLVTIRGFLGMLAKDLREDRPERVQDDFKRIAGAAAKMDTLLSGLLELSRIGRVLNPPEPVDTAQLVQEALENLHARIHSLGISVRVAERLPTLYGDRLRLREVFENLIDNAAKYMGDQPQPVIEIGVRGRAAEPVFFIKDNGMGIEPQFHAKVFGLFEKLHPTIEGTGIGLAMVKRIVETHGGRIWIESEGPGHGSSFCFTIPQNQLEPPAA